VTWLVVFLLYAVGAVILWVAIGNIRAVRRARRRRRRHADLAEMTRVLRLDRDKK